MAKAEEKIAYCQVDAHLDTNPKIRKAGRDGRDIFEFLLRRVAIGRTAGTVPLKYLEVDYLAEQLMMSCDEARHGTSRAVTARLIEIDETAGVVRVVGWSEEWGRRPKDGKERTADWRERSAKQPKSNTPVTLGDDARRSVTLGDESDAGEEMRGEEKRGGSDSAPPPAAPFADTKQSICWFAWNKAATEHRSLKASGVDANARPWPGLPLGEGAKQLNERIAELGSTADKREATEAALSHVIAVRIAEARRTSSLRYFTATTMWSSQSFWKASEQSLEQATEGPPVRDAPGRPSPQPIRASKQL